MHCITPQKILYFCIAILVLSGSAFAQENKGEVGFSQKYYSKDVHFTDFEQIHINKIDLRDMKVKTITRDDETIYDPIPGDILQELGIDTFKVFAKNLASVLPVNDDDEAPDLAAKKAIIIDIKLKGTYENDKHVFLVKLFTGKEELPTKTDLSIEITVSDARTNKPICKLRDTQELIIQKLSQPFFAPEDTAEFDRLTDLWSRRLGNILAAK